MRDDTSQHSFFPRRMLANARARFEFGDALLFLYVLVFVRQYLWVIGDNRLAWVLTVLLAAVAWLLYVSTKPSRSERAGREFWLLVGLPLLFLYALRAPFPDTSFDVLNYRLLHAERSLRGTLFAPGDFFPTPAPYNPAPDTLTGLFRHALGYRLGTVVNLFALVWAGQVLDKILRPFVTRAWVRSACVLLALLAEHVLLEVNTYMVDLLALPLLLEATYLALRAGEIEDQRTLHIHAALLLGTCAALKLTNATAIAAIVLVFVYQALAGKRRLAPKQLAQTSLLALTAFVAPVLPFAVYLWRTTGNPFFPLANGLFKSPYWPTSGGWDSRWGPFGFWETLAWPVLAAFEPARHSELAIYSGRLAVGFFAALIGFALAWRNVRIRVLCALLLTGGVIWSVAGMGYSRYGLYLEILAGAVVVAVASDLLRGARGAFSWTKVVASILLIALTAQAALACHYLFGHGWGAHETAISDWRSYSYESRFFLRDHSLQSFLPEHERALLGTVPIWVESGVKSNGIETMLDSSAPIIAVNHEEYFATRVSRQRFMRAVEAASPQMLSLCFPEDLVSAKEFVASRGLEVGHVTAVRIPFFSPRQEIGMVLVEVSRAKGVEALARLDSFLTALGFAEADYRAEITALNFPATMRAGERVALRFRVRNAGGSVWPARGNAKGMYQVNIGNRWLAADGATLVNDLDGRSALPADLPPGGEVELPLTVNVPREAGEYVLEIDMVHEGVAFFREKGSRALTLRVRVGP